MPKFDVEANLLKDAEAWHREWNEKNNAAVSVIAQDGREGKLWAGGQDLPRDEWHDEQARWFFWSQYGREMSRADKMKSADARLHESIVHCMQFARDDERKRIASALSSGLQAILGTEFHAIMAEIASIHGLD